MKKVLFVCYGGGHVRMVLPVARLLQSRGLAQVQVLGLTTAADVVRQAGLPLLQFKDVVRVEDAAAIAHGERLAAALGNTIDFEESAAYLGLSYAELTDAEGEEAAAARYAREGRQAFLPVRTLQRVLARERPDLVVATNSPRAERAAILAARQAGIPSACMVDLFAIDEVAWIGAPDYADRVLVLNEGVRSFLVAHGRRPDDVVVTGNPAFDALLDPAVVEAGHALRARQGWQGRRVVLWADQVEPAVHPFTGAPGRPELPGQAREALQAWAAAHEDAVVCIRPRPGQVAPELGGHPRVVLTGQDWPLPPLLHAVDVVATLNSTVGLEGRLAGARLVQVLGSAFDAAMPLARFGLADAAVGVERLVAEVERLSRSGRHATTGGAGQAVERVVAALGGFL